MSGNVSTTCSDVQCWEVLSLCLMRGIGSAYHCKFLVGWVRDGPSQDQCRCFQCGHSMPQSCCLYSPLPLPSLVWLLLLLQRGSRGFQEEHKSSHTTLRVFASLGWGLCNMNRHFWQETYLSELCALPALLAQGQAPCSTARQPESNEPPSLCKSSVST